MRWATITRPSDARNRQHLAHGSTRVSLGQVRGLQSSIGAADKARGGLKNYVRYRDTNFTATKSPQYKLRQNCTPHIKCQPLQGHQGANKSKNSGTK